MSEYLGRIGKPTALSGPLRSTAIACAHVHGLSAN
jgi:hypothetical protein